MSKSLSSADIVAMAQSEQVGFILTANVTKSRVVPCKDGCEKTVTSALVVRKGGEVPVMIDGEQWTLKVDNFSDSVVLERWSETEAQAKANAKVRAANAKAAADEAADDIPS